jgi:hypothetical protein
MRWIIRIVAGLLAVLIVVIGGVAFYLNEVIQTAIERGGSHALGVPTGIDSVSLRPIMGSLRLGGLTIANPPGFKAENFIRLGEGSLELDTATLRQPTIEIHELRLADVELALEKSAQGTNYDVILKNMKKSDAAAEDTGDGGDSGTALIIHELLIQDVLAHYDVAGGLGSVDVTIPEVRLTELGGKDDPVTMSELSQIIVQALLASVARYGVDLPADLARGLTTGLSSLGTAGYELTGKVGSTVSETGAALGRTTTDTARGAADAVGKSAGKAVESLGGLLGKKKDDK